MPAKNLFSSSSVKVRNIALVQLRKNLTSRNTDTHTRKTALHPNPKNPIAFSQKRILPNPPNPKATDVLSVRKKGISQEFVQTALINQFVSLNIFNDDVESFFSEQEDYDEQTTFILIDDHFLSNPNNTINTHNPASPVGSRMWRCLHQIYNRTGFVLRASSPQVLVSSRYTLIHQIPNPKIIFENSFSPHYPKTRHSWPSKRVNVVRKHFHFIKIGFGG